MCQKKDQNAEAERARQEIEAMENAVEKHGWDGGWYLRAYDHFGQKIGSKDNDEGQIFIETQGFCSMAEIGLNIEFGQPFLNKSPVGPGLGSNLLVAPLQPAEGSVLVGIDMKP